MIEKLKKIILKTGLYKTGTVNIASVEYGPEIHRIVKIICAGTTEPHGAVPRQWVLWKNANNGWISRNLIRRDAIRIVISAGATKYTANFTMFFIRTVLLIAGVITYLRQRVMRSKTKAAL